MMTASTLAGFFAAHALWCLSDSEMLIPMVAYTTADGERKMERLVSEDLSESVARESDVGRERDGRGRRGTPL